MCSEQRSSSLLATLSTLFFFFPLLAAPRTMWDLPLHWEQRGHRTAQGRPSTVVYIREGPSPAFLMSWFAFGEITESHSSWVFTVFSASSSLATPGISRSSHFPSLWQGTWAGQAFSRPGQLRGV